jgi:DNA-binding NarL/FixJ family response regulator
MEHKQPSCVIVADRHPILLRTLKSLLEPEFEVIGMVDNAISLVDAMNACEPDALVVEMSMRGHGGENLARHLIRRYPHIPLIALGDEDDPVIETEAAELGAAAFVAKSNAARDLNQGVRRALSGDRA